MKLASRNIIRTISLLAAIALAWGVTSGWHSTNPNSDGRASAAALTVQSVSMAPNNAHTLDPKRAASPDSPEASLGTGFTYQGRLLDNSVPANGQYDLIFTLFDALSGGNQVSSPVNLTNQTVASGLFTVSLDFGANAFNGEARWLEIAARATGGNTYTTLVPRQALTAAPFALSSRWEGTSSKPFPYNHLPQANSLSTIDSSGDVGRYTSIAVGADGLALISYSDETNHRLKIAHCSDRACTSATTAMLDAAGSVGQYTSLVIGSDGLGLISYYDYTNLDLKVAHCNNVTCSAAAIAVVDPQGDAGMSTAITIGVDGMGLIAYYDLTNHNLKVAHCGNLACNSSSAVTIDSQGVTGPYVSITVGADGFGLVAYRDQVNNHLKVAHCSDVQCSSATTTTIDTAAYTGWYPSITTGTDGLGLISYHDAANNQLKVAHCSNLVCTTATISTIASPSNSEQFTSITTGTDGLGLISYSDGDLNGNLKIAHCADLTCTSATTATIDSGGSRGYFSALTTGTDGLGLISYYDYTNLDLKVAHCASPLCLPYQQGR